jgi:hypothetical protein
MSEEEPVNPKPELEEACKPACIKAWLEYQVRRSEAQSSYILTHNQDKPRELSQLELSLALLLSSRGLDAYRRVQNEWRRIQQGRRTARGR